jgi:hypothetical protein
MKISNFNTATSKDRYFFDKNLLNDTNPTELSLNPEKSRKMKKMTIQKE